MAADCSFFLSSTAFMTVFAPYYSADGSVLLILPLVNGFHDGLCAVLHSGWRGGSLILSLVNGFHNGLRAALLSGWQQIAHTSTHQHLSRRFARCIAQRMAPDCSFFLLSTAFTTVCAPYCSADGSTLLILPFINGFSDGFRAVLLSRWQRIAHSFFHHRLSRRFSRRIAQWMAAYCSFFDSSTAFTTVCAPYCPADGIGLLILALINGFHDGLRAAFLCGCQWIAHSFSGQRLSRWFSRRIARRIARWIDYSYAALRTGSMPYGSMEGRSAHLWVHSYLPLVSDFANVLRAVDCSLYHSFFRSSTSVIPGRFAYRTPQWMAADCSFLHSSMAFTMVFAPYCSADG